MSLYRKLTPAEVLAMVGNRNTVIPRNTNEVVVTAGGSKDGAVPVVVDVVPEQTQAGDCGGDSLGENTGEGTAVPVEVAKNTNARYKLGQAAYMRAYRARKKAEKAGRTV